MKIERGRYMPVGHDEEASANQHYEERIAASRPVSLRNCIWHGSLAISILLNLFLIGKLSWTSSDHNGVEKSPYAGLEYDTQIKFVVTSDYSSENETLADLRWDALDTKPGAIALSDEYAKANGIPHARRFPWDDDKGLYYVQGFHLLHCMKSIRNSWNQHRRGLDQTVDEGHIKHCFDAVRTSIMCSASDLPLPAQDPPLYIGEGQSLTCRNWEKLTEWALDLERNGCYLGGEDELEVGGAAVFGRCPEGSPYKAIAEEYLSQHQ